MQEAMDTQQLLADECDERRINTPSLRRTAAAGVLAAVVLAFTFFAFFRTTTHRTKTIELHWTVTNTSQNLDGVARFALGINGRPSHEARIDATRGDRVVVRLTNGLRVPTSLHFHGMVQRGSAFSDGPSAVTQCPIAPGATYVYNFTTEEVSGSYWWHAHYHLHQADGLRGPMVIHDPNEEKPYSKDHFLQLADWYHDQSEDLLAWFLNSTTNPDGNEPVWNSGLINGIGQFNCSDVPSILDCTTKTPYIQEIEPGSTVRLRLVNMGTFAAFLVGIDGHDMTVIEVDGTRVNPYVVDMLTINVGQRYSVLVTASLKPANYWIRATMYHGDPWTSVSNMPPGFDADVRAILNYQGIPRTSPPVAMEPKFRRQQSSQHQEPLTIMNNVGDMALVPLISKKPPPSDTVILYEFDFDTKPGDLYQKAYNSLYQLNTHNNKSQWTHLFTSSFYQAATPPPLLVSAHSNGFLWSPPASANTVFLNPGAVVDFIIRNDDPGEHPFHIHGHFFWVMAAGIANSIAHIPSGRALNQIKNPLRRDVVTVSACPHGEDTECLEASMTDFPGYSQASRSAAAAAAGDARLPPSPSGRDRWFGYAVVRIVADNPGLWLMHCHINWHTANGLSITLVESIGGITELEKPDGVDESCESFKNWEGDSDGSAP